MIHHVAFCKQSMVDVMFFHLKKQNITEEEVDFYLRPWTIFQISSIDVETPDVFWPQLYKYASSPKRMNQWDV